LEKSQIHYIYISQPASPVGLGEVEGVAHDYIGMAPRRCLLHWMWQPAKSSGNARRGTGTGTGTGTMIFCHFCAISTRPFLKSWTCI
jgi:hypothetical protein